MNFIFRSTIAPNCMPRKDIQPRHRPRLPQRRTTSTPTGDMQKICFPFLYETATFVMPYSKCSFYVNGTHGTRKKWRWRHFHFQPVLRDIKDLLGDSRFALHLIPVVLSPLIPPYRKMDTTGCRMGWRMTKSQFGTYYMNAIPVPYII